MQPTGAHIDGCNHAPFNHAHIHPQVPDDHYTPLQFAARRDGSDAGVMVRALIDAGCDVEGRGTLGVAPLNLAARAGNAGAVGALLDAGAAREGGDVLGHTAASHAATAAVLALLRGDAEPEFIELALPRSPSAGRTRSERGREEDAQLWEFLQQMSLSAEPDPKSAAEAPAALALEEAIDTPAPNAGGAGDEADLFAVLVRYYKTHAPGVKTAQQLRSLAAEMALAGGIAIERISDAMQVEHGISLAEFRDRELPRAEPPDGMHVVSPAPWPWLGLGFDHRSCIAQLHTVHQDASPVFCLSNQFHLIAAVCLSLADLCSQSDGVPDRPLQAPRRGFRPLQRNVRTPANELGLC